MSTLRLSICLQLLLVLVTSSVLAHGNNEIKKYIITLHDCASIVNHTNRIRIALEKSAPMSQTVPTSLTYNSANSAVDECDGQPKTRYKIKTSFVVNKFQGYAAELSSNALRIIRKDPDVLIVEEDFIMNAQAIQSSPPSWGLGRLSSDNVSVNIDTDGNTQIKYLPYEYPDLGGNGTTAYIIDSGIDLDHPDFKGRVRWGATFCKDCIDKDDNGHGTAVAGILGGSIYGVAKLVDLVAVKTLNVTGSGETSDIIKALVWIVKQENNLKKSGRRTAIVNISISGDKSESLNGAVEAAIRTGITVVVAGGNQQKDACDYSPSSAEGVVAVGGFDQYDNYSPETNTGRCIAIYAPGAEITTAALGGSSITSLGTSLSAAHMAGAIALKLGDNPIMTGVEAVKQVISEALQGKLQDVNGIPGLILHIPRQPPPPPPPPSLPPPPKCYRTAIKRSSV